MKNYRTVADEIFSAEYEIKKSRFIANIKHVETEETAREFVQSVKKKYFDATHNCSAWILGEVGNLQKSNDDGEPGGTAGNPILDIRVESSDYADVVTLTILILPDDVENFLIELTDLTAANFLHELQEKILLPIEE